MKIRLAQFSTDREAQLYLAWVEKVLADADHYSGVISIDTDESVLFKYQVMGDICYDGSEKDENSNYFISYLNGAMLSEFMYLLGISAQCKERMESLQR